jgi:hypothetical protein
MKHKQHSTDRVPEQAEQLVAPRSAWHSLPLFRPDAALLVDDGGLNQTQKQQLYLDGHVVLPGVLAPETVERTVSALVRIDELEAEFARTAMGRRKAEILQRLEQPQPLHPRERKELQRELNSWGADGGHGMRMNIGQVVAEHDEYLESILGHPQMLALARSVLGDELRFDHQCTSSGRHAGNEGMGYHSHNYADEHPQIGYIRVFFYLNGFELENGNLKTVPGSHLFRTDTGSGRTDADIMAWAADKRHPISAKPLAIRKLACPPGSVVVMWTHATHGVDPKPAGSERRWALITAYRNPGAPLDPETGIAIGFPNWMTPNYRDAPTPGLAPCHKRWD